MGTKREKSFFDMTLSTKQKWIIWITVFFVVFFLGLNTNEGAPSSYPGYVDLYGITIWRTLNRTSQFFFILYRMSLNQYELIVATLVICLAGILTSKKNIG
jgi:hypothetical protein